MGISREEVEGAAILERMVPDADHDLHCNADRENPMGSAGCSCFMYQRALKAESEIGKLQEQLDDRNRHIAGAYDALGDVNRSVYLFDHIAKLMEQLTEAKAEIEKLGNETNGLYSHLAEADFGFGGWYASLGGLKHLLEKGEYKSALGLVSNLLADACELDHERCKDKRLAEIHDELTALRQKVERLEKRGEANVE